MIDLPVDLVFGSLLFAVLLLVIGAAARKNRKQTTLTELVLANRSLGFGLLVLTWFATQYSGNAFSGIPGQTVRDGLALIMSVTFGVALVAGFMLFAPSLYRLSRAEHFITPTDFLAHRFGNGVLNYVSVAVFVAALTNFLLAQLMALGVAFDALSGGETPYWIAVVIGGAVIAAYTTMGGMRAVAWTDTVQGLLMIVGLVLIVVLIWREVGRPDAVVRTVNLLHPEFVANPNWRMCFAWLSNVMLLGFGAPLYPQAIQRIYSARNLPALRSTLGTLAVVPLVVSTAAVFIGATGVAVFPQIDPATADRVTFRVLRYIVESNVALYYPALVVMIAIVAATMSTADSCLLSLSSIVTKDVVARRRNLTHEQADKLVRPLAIAGVIIMIVAIGLAMRPRMTLWGLLIVKFEILMQLSPAFVFGSLHDRAHERAYTVSDILPGILAGLALTLSLYITGNQSVVGFHAGTVGFLANYGIVIARRWSRLRYNQPSMSHV